jgi:hypothetical protein
MPAELDDLQVFCADVGSIPNQNFAWACRLPPDSDEEVHSPASIESLAGAVISSLEAGRLVALGFEMPLFLPVPEAPLLLGTARPTDKGAPAWSSSPGASALATGMVQAAWVLRAIHRSLPDVPLFVQWDDTFTEAETGLLIWEAFVTGDAKGTDHEEDAAIAVAAFCAQLPAPGDAEAAEIEGPLSIVTALCAWAGWDLPGELLRRAGVVVRAR